MLFTNLLYKYIIYADTAKMDVCEGESIVLSKEMELHLTLEEISLLKHIRKSYLYSHLPYYDRGM